MSSFPTSAKTYTAVAAKSALPYDVVQSYQDEIAAIEAKLVNGWNRAKAYHSVQQSLANATLTAILFDTENWDTDGMHSTSSNTSRFTVPASGGGLYRVSARISYVTNTIGVRVARLRLNGADCESSQVTLAAGGSTANIIVPFYDEIILAAGDYVEIWGFQDSGGALNTGDATTRALRNQMSIARQW